MRKFRTKVAGAALACCLSVAACTTAFASPCGERDGIKIATPPAGLRALTAELQMCERTLTMGNAHLDVGPRSCTNQRERCISYREMRGPMGSEWVCVRVYRACLRSGVWDATAAFPYGGVRITGMIRR